MVGLYCTATVDNGTTQESEKATNAARGYALAWCSTTEGSKIGSCARTVEAASCLVRGWNDDLDMVHSGGPEET
ncbi:hypothetical protein PR202_ga30150 [Eleusine coracana subsp. coracana]|uniref:Uncharacterized protein n=1 Tax=Eleusine coracana subsp. coracana TaxID=191504 RepID=A0AAV5DNI9_ELECO|nr:hypothetical protein PR202_ga30150 [Eleusine coracana subsp. coracana]